jgi:CRISPR-associated endonuclease Cas2
MASEEIIHCLVVYDVVEDGIRQRFADACMDFGLERFQMSAFWGRITPQRRRELFLKLCDLLGDTPGRILVQPVSAGDVEKRHVFQRIPKKGAGKRESKPWPEPGAPRPSILKF